MLLDNKNHGKVVTELKQSISSGAKLSVLSGFFSIYGYAVLKKELAALVETRLLLSNWNDDIALKVAGGSTELRFKNHLDQAHVAGECASWLQKKVEIKALSGIGVNQNLFHVGNQDGSVLGIQGSSSFTAHGLGETQSSVLEINIAVKEASSSKQMLQWFDSVWNDPKAARDIKQD